MNFIQLYVITKLNIKNPRNVELCYCYSGYFHDKNIEVYNKYGKERRKSLQLRQLCTISRLFILP